MKNLKKVLALVLCCAMVFGVVATAAGTNYPDVPADATYAEAVNVLSSFGIIQGDDEGNFNPDATITRAEMAKILYTIVSRADVSKSATKFTDVPAEHWASGYIAYCTQLGYIDGYDATTFGPEDPVTYEQVLKLVLCAMGYKPAADYQGGYPTGYLMVGADIGLTKGITSISGPNEAPRSVVAVAVYNAINTPIMKQVNYGSDAKYVAMDGTAEANYVYQTLLNKVYNTFKVEGKVVANSKTGLSASVELKAGYVKFDITNTLKVDPIEFGGVANEYPSTDSPLSLNNVYAEGTGADELLGKESVAYLTVLDDGSYEIVSIVKKQNKNIETVIPTADQIYDQSKDLAVNERDTFNLTTGNSSGKLIYSYWNDRGVDTRIQTVEVDSNAYIIWNGEVVGRLEDMNANALTPYNADDSFNENNRVRPQVGSVVLTDVDNDGKVDIIESKSYGVAVVRNANTSTNRITFYSATKGLSGSIVLDKDENPDLKEWTITMDGKEIGLEDIKEYDVLDICTNDYSNPTFYEIIVTRKVVEGSVDEVDEINNRYGINGDMYRITDGMNNVSLGIEDEGYFYLDMDGRIAYVDTSVSLTGKYAYLVRMGATNYDDEKEMKIFTADGLQTLDVATKVKINGVSKTNLSTAYTKGDIDKIFEDASNYTPFGNAVAGDKALLSDVFEAGTFDKYLDEKTKADNGVTPAILLHALTNDVAAGIAAPVFKDNFLDAMTGDAITNKMVGYDAADGTLRAVDLALNAPNNEKIFNFVRSYVGSPVEWKANVNKFGNSKVLAEGAQVFMCESGAPSEEYQAMTIDELRDGGDYEPILFGNTANGVTLVLLLSDAGTVDPTSPVAIFDSSTTSRIDGVDITNIKFYENGSKASKALQVDSADVTVEGMRSSLEDIQLGDVFLYSKNSKGYVDKIQVIFAPGTTAPAMDGTADFKDMMWLPNADWDFADSDSNADSKIYFGYLSDQPGKGSNNSVAINVMDGDGIYDNAITFNVPMDASVVFYRPAYPKTETIRLQGGKTINDITFSYYGKDANKNIDFTSEETTSDNMYYVFVRMVEDVPTEVIYVNYTSR